MNAELIEDIKLFIFNRKYSIGTEFPKLFNSDITQFAKNIITYINTRFSNLPISNLEVVTIQINKLLYDVRIIFVAENRDEAELVHITLAYKYNSRTTQCNFEFVDESKSMIVEQDLQSMTDDEDENGEDPEDYDNNNKFIPIVESSKWDSVAYEDLSKDLYDDYKYPSVADGFNAYSVSEQVTPEDVDNIYNYITNYIRLKISSFGVLQIESNSGVEVVYLYNDNNVLNLNIVPAIDKNSIENMLKFIIEKSVGIINFYLVYDHTSIGKDYQENNYIWKKVEVIQYNTSTKAWSHKSPKEVQSFVCTDYDTGEFIGNLPHHVYCGKHPEDFLFI